MNNYIYEYYQAITSGEIVVGRWVLLWYERIIRGLEEQKYWYSPKRAKKAIKFIENFVHHHEGVLAPQLLKLELWQKAILSVIFGIVDENGNRQFREVMIVVARKSGKTLFAAGIAEYMTFLDDYGSRIYFAAPKLEQANLCFEAFYQSIIQEPELSGMTRKRRTDIYIPDNNATAKPLAFSAKKSDGLNVSCAILDEVASWSGDAGLKFYEVIKSSVGARKEPLIISISTAGYENDGIYDELIKRGTRVILGDSKETRLAPFLYTIDDVQKWNDINELRKSNPNLGVSVSVDYMLEEINIAEGSLSKKAEFITKYCNIKQNSSTAWLDYITVDNACGNALNIVEFDHCYCVCGIDLSQTTDITSVCAVIERNGEFYVFSHFFMPANRIETATATDGVPYEIFREQGFLTLSGENFVDYKDCYNWIIDLVRKYHVIPLMIGYDRYSAQYLIDDIQSAGLRCDDVYQGHNLSPVIKEFEGLIKDGRVHIGDNNLLKSHLLNAALKQDIETQKVKMIKSGTRTRIDGAAALLDAFCVRQKWYAEIGKQLTNRR